MPLNKEELSGAINQAMEKLLDDVSVLRLRHTQAIEALADYDDDVAGLQEVEALYYPLDAFKGTCHTLVDSVNDLEDAVDREMLEALEAKMTDTEQPPHMGQHPWPQPQM
jgi:hypothetical protein